MANEELDQVEEQVESDTAEPVLEATDDEDTEELVEFQASGEASSVPDQLTWVRLVAKPIRTMECQWKS